MVKNPSASVGSRKRIGFKPLGREDPLEKGMATHSVILAPKIPWTEEPGRLQPEGSQRVGYTLSMHAQHALSHHFAAI